MYTLTIYGKDPDKHTFIHEISGFKSVVSAYNFVDEKGWKYLEEKLNEAWNRSDICYNYCSATTDEDYLNKKYQSLVDMADTINNLRIELYQSKRHRKYFFDDSDDISYVDNELFKIQSDLRRLKEYIYNED